MDYKEWEDELYLYYIRTDYLPMMTFETFINYAKGNEKIERELGIKFYEEVSPQTKTKGSIE